MGWAAHLLGFAQSKTLLLEALLEREECHHDVVGGLDFADFDALVAAWVDCLASFVAVEHRLGVACVAGPGFAVEGYVCVLVDRLEGFDFVVLMARLRFVQQLKVEGFCLAHLVLLAHVRRQAS